MADLLSKAHKVFTRPRGLIPLLRWQTPTCLLGWGNLPSDKPGGANRLTLFALDLPGGHLTPLSYPKPFFWGDRGAFSPTGQWLLQCSQLSDTPLCIQALSLDGKRRLLWTLGTKPLFAPGRLCPASNPLWTQGGRGWVMLVSRDTPGQTRPLMAVTGCLDQPGRVRTIPLGSVSDATGGYWSRMGLHISRLIDSPDDDLLVGVSRALWPKPGGPRLVRFALRLSHKGRDRQEQVLLSDQGEPDSQEVGDWDYCPATRRLALLVGAELIQGGSQRLCVMSLDGRQKQVLGQIQGGREQFARNIQWLPGGRQLSFERRDGFWLLDVPPSPPSDAHLITER